MGDRAAAAAVVSGRLRRWGGEGGRGRGKRRRTREGHATASFLQRIPDNFVRKVRDELSAVSTLNVPDGSVWHIGIQKIDNKFWFHEGWQNFAEHYSIGVGYFLVFGYEGNSIFNIYIFNLTTSEINYHSNTRHNPHYSRQLNIFKEMEDDDVAALFGSSSLSASNASLKRKAIGGSSAAADHLTLNRGFAPMTMHNLFNGNMHHQQQKNALGSHAAGMRAIPDIIVQAGGIKFRSGEDDVKMSSPSDQVMKKVKKPRKKWKSDPNLPMSGTPTDSESSESRFRFYASASTRKRTVTAEERERAINAAKTFEPDNPFCRVVLRPSYLYRGCIMYLPSCFTEKHLNGVSGFIKLQLPDGRQWQVRCLYRAGRVKLSQGWYDFCLENNLAEGDVCVFELIRARDIVLKVYLFRVMDEAGMVNPRLHGR
ncbi:hypothetical protein MLD38_013552 [Melastoma candidum]|uniref:Uncharacterized protein n=1 Tax=Melastoma candidum TaxID=119954 RepID=A0ACB9R9X0_9MYRT|nr:hypothetical protein MLD38_013552 [Melastoma candidum]